jgi:hypothetical protein
MWLDILMQWCLIGLAVALTFGIMARRIAQEEQEREDDEQA